MGGDDSAGCARSSMTSAPAPRRADRPTSPSAAWIVVLNSVALLTLHQFLHLSSIASVPSAGTFDHPTSASSPFGWKIPEGRATPLPSVRVAEDAVVRREYGGKGDKPHLGGFTSFDAGGVGVHLWTYMMTHLGIRSVLDLGCGRGISTSWFVLHGVERAVCAEGSHDAVERSILPAMEGVAPGSGGRWEIVEHDFSRGPWWPDGTVDVAWCVEFSEHVGRNFQMNYHTAFRKAALIFVTHSIWGGWHHVEVHDDAWWQVKMESSGFVYSDVLTQEMRAKAKEEPPREEWVRDMKRRNGTMPESFSHHDLSLHLWAHLQVFINPLVASLPEHQHLFAEHGCFKNKQHNYECGTKGDNLTPLPERFKPLKMTKEMDDQWMELVKNMFPTE